MPAAPALIAAALVWVPGAESRPCDPVISELMAANRTTLLDEDGDSSDWLEIHNPCPDAVDLDGWYLTDAPGDLRRWRLPAVTVEGGGYLVAFASGKDRGDAAGELHTSFRLSSGGEFLALVRPDGATVAHRYTDLPEQRPDFSYGIGEDRVVEPILPAGAAARVTVPLDGSPGAAWTGGSEPFDDSLWRSGNTGAGYLIALPGFAVRTFIATAGVGSLSTAEDVIRTPALQAQVHSENAPLIDYFNTGGTGHYPLDAPFPGTSVGDDANNFVVEATGTVTLPFAGAWTFGVSSDDGFGLDIAGNGATFRIEFPAPRGPGDTLGVFNAPVAGAYDVRLVFYEQGGGSELELFAVRGSRGVWDSTFRRVGDVAAGGLAAESQPVGGSSSAGLRSLIRTDLRSAMHQVSASAYLRLPFAVPDPAAHGSLFLRMAYDDGFVAYLNGFEIARRNAPASPAFDSWATADRPSSQAVLFQDIDVSEHLGRLRAGNNVLAVHGLNDSPQSRDFLILPELADITVLSMAQGFFRQPTPGAANGSIFTGFVADTKFEPDRGFYDAPFLVTISSATPGAEIRYTTDGSAPSPTNGQAFAGPIPVSGTTTLRAAAFKEGFLPTDIDTHTYIFLENVLTQTGAGFPSTWAGVPADYEVDPAVVNDPRYAAGFRQDLLSLPSLSIVMSVDDMWGPTRGIYSHAEGSGIAWERPGSVELLLPPGMEGPAGDGAGFQINCGVRMQGGVGRIASVPKHSFRFLFKSAYGPARLDYPLFGDDATESFDTVTLRAGFNNSWVFNSPGEMQQAQYLRDEFSRRSGLAMGQAQSHGTHVHLYLNGLYWGLYNLCERPSAPFAAAYYGGEKEEWDVLNSSEPVDGTRAAWDVLQGLANAGVATPQAYRAIQDYVDVPNLIDYMILNFHGGNSDWDGHNWYAGRRRLPGAGYKFFSWDAERTLEGVGGDARTGINEADKPSRIYSQLRANPEFRMLFADHSQRHFASGGALSPEVCRERYRRMAESIHGGIVGESARWGDAHREPPFTRDAEWVTERDRLLGSYFPQRTQVVLAQFRTAGLYPAVEAPRFSRPSGRIEPGAGLIITAQEGTIYYTLDGSDPRLEGGAVAPGAAIAGTVEATTLVPSGAAVRAFVPANGSLGLDWTLPEFNDSAWLAGTTGVGFERSSGYEALIGTDLNALMGPSSSSFYLRLGFDVPDPASLSFIDLRVKYDDGFAAYLNGRLVAARNAPASPAWDSVATASHPDDQAVVFESIEIPAAAAFLRPGRNVLAIHGLNNTPGSSDLLILPELRAIEASGQGIVLPGTRRVRARALVGSEWSALAEAFYHVDLPLRVSEIMYHPRVPEEGSDFAADAFEFIELANVGEGYLDLEGYRLEGGIDFAFAGTFITLEPGGVVLVVNDLRAFDERYPFLGALVAGEYERRLGNDGDRIRLVGPAGEPLLDFDYADTWYPETDGEGSSLVSAAPGGPPETWGEESAWLPSPEVDGSPGRIDLEPPPPGGRQIAGNLNQDASLDIADALRLLAHLFDGGRLPLPCDGSSIDDGGNRVLADLDGSGAVDLTDVLRLLNYLLLNGPPPAAGTGCFRVPGCATSCPF